MAKIISLKLLLIVIYLNGQQKAEQVTGISKN